MSLIAAEDATPPSVTLPARRSFRCACENGHAYTVETVDDEEKARAILRAAKCPTCGAAPFTAVERHE